MTIYVGQLEYCGYTLRVCAESEDAAKQALLDHIEEHNRRDGGGDTLTTRYDGEKTPEEFWEYVGGYVHAMPMGKVDWQ